jgi:hypothetical protein
MEDTEHDQESVVTNHATQRLKERAGIGKKSSKNMAEKALERGLTHADLQGNLKKYVDGAFKRSKSGNNFRVYGEKLYVFKDNILITVFNLPNNLKKVANKLSKRK